MIELLGLANYTDDLESEYGFIKCVATADGGCCNRSHFSRRVAVVSG